MAQPHYSEVPPPSFSMIKGTPIGTWISLVMALITALGYFYTHMAEIDKTSKDQVDMKADIREVRGSVERLDSKLSEIDGKLNALLSQQQKNRK